MSVLENAEPRDRGFRALALRLRETLMLPICIAVLLLVLLGVLGILF